MRFLCCLVVFSLFLLSAMMRLTLFCRIASCRQSALYEYCYTVLSTCKVDLIFRNLVTASLRSHDVIEHRTANTAQHYIISYHITSYYDALYRRLSSISLHYAYGINQHRIIYVNPPTKSVTRNSFRYSALHCSN